ncbi:hypothetical protein M3Y99_00104000 [Aphelenchoides fujianensis]|nr:hypothetical protein M3Y99_00104000 [Aphelenchoides fujianensis]
MARNRPVDNQQALEETDAIPSKRRRTDQPDVLPLHSQNDAEAGEQNGAALSGLQQQTAVPTAEPSAEVQLERFLEVTKRALRGLVELKSRDHQQRENELAAAFAAATTGMVKLDGRIDLLEETNDELKRLNAQHEAKVVEQTREIAELKRQLAEASGATGVNHESFPPTPASQTESPLDQTADVFVETERREEVDAELRGTLSDRRTGLLAAQQPAETPPEAQTMESDDVEAAERPAEANVATRGHVSTIFF